MRRRGFPFSQKLLRVGRATLLHQHSSKKPTTQLSGLFSAILISRLRRLFSLILWIRRGDPALGPSPVHPHPLKGGPDGLPRNSLFSKPLLEAYFGGHLQSPQAGVPAEASRSIVKHLLELLGLLLIESRVDGMRPTRAFAKRLFEALLVELDDDVSDGLIMATEGPGDLVSGFAISTCKQDLAAAQNEGIRRAQTRLQGLTLVVRERTHEDRFFHDDRINSCLPSRLRMQRLPFSKFASLAHPRRRSLIVGSIAAAGVSFVVGLMIVTGVEASVGKSLSCWVWSNCSTESSTSTTGDGSTSQPTSTLASMFGGSQGVISNTPKDAPSSPQQQHSVGSSAPGTPPQSPSQAPPPGTPGAETPPGVETPPPSAPS